MPIHDQGYRRYVGHRDAIGRGWLVILRAGVKHILGRRLFLGLLLLAWIPFLIRAVQIYVSSNLPQASFLAPRAEMFREFIDQQSFVVFLITIYVGSGLIANDRRANALQVYLSKPLTRIEYVAGKLAILIVFLALVTFVPAISLLVVEVIFAGNFTFLRQNLFLLPAITLYSAIEVLLASTTMLALSSLSKSSRFAAVMYAGLTFFTLGMFQALRAITGNSSFAWISSGAVLEQVGDFIFRLPLRYELPLPFATLTLVVLLGLSFFVLERRVRGIEVVK